MVTLGVLTPHSTKILLDKERELAGVPLSCRRAVRLEAAQESQLTSAASAHLPGGVNTFGVSLQDPATPATARNTLGRSF